MTDPATLIGVDVHGHYGTMIRETDPLLDEFMTGSADLVARRARDAGVSWTVVSPLKALVPRWSGRGDPVGGNEEASQVVPRTPGLLQWVVIDPTRPRTFEQADRMLRYPWCVGVKLHPEEHQYPIAEHGDAIFSFLAERAAVVLTHSGEANSLPADFLVFADRYQEVRLILGHLGAGIGNGPAGDASLQVRAVQASRHGNVWTETSSSRSIWSGLIEWAVREIGAERILFGTDTPLYSTAAQRARIEQAEIAPADRELILGRNAVALLGLEGLDQNG